jgi:hypothetical protein
VHKTWIVTTPGLASNFSQSLSAAFLKKAAKSAALAANQ